jgi:hypothetical protein
MVVIYEYFNAPFKHLSREIEKNHQVKRKCDLFAENRSWILLGGVPDFVLRKKDELCQENDYSLLPKPATNCT